MLDSLKDRVFGRKKDDMDFGDVRSHVIGENRFSEPPNLRDKFGLDKPAEFNEPFPRDPYAEPPQFQQQPAGFGQRPDPRMDFGMEQSREQPRMDYDIMDRLNLIESQLAAIRSQTETINERLKNIDAKLAGRRY